MRYVKIYRRVKPLFSSDPYYNNLLPNLEHLKITPQVNFKDGVIYDKFFDSQNQKMSEMQIQMSPDWMKGDQKVYGNQLHLYLREDLVEEYARRAEEDLNRTFHTLSIQVSLNLNVPFKLIVFEELELHPKLEREEHIFEFASKEREALFSGKVTIEDCYSKDNQICLYLSNNMQISDRWFYLTDLNQILLPTVTLNGKAHPDYQVLFVSYLEYEKAVMQRVLNVLD